MLSSNQFQALSNAAAENGIELELATIPRVHADGQSVWQFVPLSS